MPRSRLRVNQGQAVGFDLAPEQVAYLSRSVPGQQEQAHRRDANKAFGFAQTQGRAELRRITRAACPLDDGVVAVSMHDPCLASVPAPPPWRSSFCSSCSDPSCSFRSRPNGDGFGYWKGRACRAQPPRGLQAVIATGLSAIRGCVDGVLISTLCGAVISHHTNFTEALTKDRTIDGFIRIFRSAKEDFEGDYAFDAEIRISGEVFGDFIVLAKHALAEDHKDVAEVLVCAALEDALKRYAIANGLNVAGRSMTDVINALKSKELVSGAQKSLLGSIPQLRNYAMHANWGKYRNLISIEL